MAVLDVPILEFAIRLQAIVKTAEAFLDAHLS